MRRDSSESTEIVTAVQLRPGDQICTPSGSRWVLAAVAHVGLNVVRLQSAVTYDNGNDSGGSRSFAVLASTRFVRLKRDRSIDTAPGRVAVGWDRHPGVAR